MILAKGLRRLIRGGSMTLIDADGVSHRIEGRRPGPDVTVRLHDRALHWSLMANPRLKVGEAYMDGGLTVDDGRLYEFLDLLGLNMADLESHPFVRVKMALERIVRVLGQYNPIGRAQRNVAHHYDLNGALYDTFLDADRQYSCAYFRTPQDTLEQAQAAKKAHIIAKLLIEPEHRVLDIGSGWGGLGLQIARDTGADVTGVTLSVEQHTVSSRRALETGLADRARFKLLDYRKETGTYDRIVSVGMFEHVGAPHYREFFAKVKSLLSDDGVMLLHSIGTMGPPGTQNPWVRKYIFPGGYTPSLSEVLRAIEHVGLFVTDVEILRLHYAETLKHWRLRFMANRDRVKAMAGYDDRFCRMWEFYLAAAEMSFRRMTQMVFQLQLAKKQSAVPLTRDYMIDGERGSRLPVAAE
ncbi:MAG: class I SAM-dependent methyltransferase [Alphaproteobacteria bacterium]|nr:class I SAM-dependent methyltransferase [Alphaproteobacteria bacterium]